MTIQRFLIAFCFTCIGCLSFSQTSVEEKKLWQAYAAASDSSVRAETLLKLSESYLSTDKALALRAYSLSKLYNKEDLYIRALVHLTNLYFSEGRTDKASVLTDELVSISEAYKGQPAYADACMIIGRRYHFQGNYSSALDNYLKGLHIVEISGNQPKCAEFYNVIGGVYLNQGNYDNAFLFFHKSLRIQLHEKRADKIARAYLNISNIKIAKKEFGKAKVLLDSALFFYTGIKSEEGQSMVYATVYEVFIARNQTDSALACLFKAHNILKRLNKLYLLTQIDLSIGQVLVKKKEHAEALLYINEGIAAGLNTRQNHNVAPLYLLKSGILEHAGKTGEAFENYKFYKAFSDSVLNAASIKKQAEDALTYDYNKKEYQRNSELQQQRILQNEKEARQRLLLLCASGFAIAVFAVMYYRYRLKKKAHEALEASNVKLAEKNKIIGLKTKELEESLGEREMLLKEIHHRVKNNLQVISGLLELQKEDLTEEGSKAAFDEGQSRVRSISLIHQNLYQNENLGSIQFKSFVNDLVMQVKEVFEQPDKKMKVSLDFPDKVLDIDTAVPLGLIINELLTNSYKYATVKNKTGTIAIHLQDKGAGDFVLNYSDSGPGIKGNLDFDTANSMGLRLIKGLAGQLGGQARYSNTNGPEFMISFKDTATRHMA